MYSTFMIIHACIHGGDGGGGSVKIVSETWRLLLKEA